MKTRLFTIGLLMSVTLSLSARMYDKGEKVYINAAQNDKVGDWSQANAKLFLYFFQSTNPGNNEWVDLSRVDPGNSYFSGSMNATHSWYDRVSVVRKSASGTAGNWDNRWNQSCDIVIPDNNDCDLIYQFFAKSNISDDCTESYEWGKYGYARTFDAGERLYIKMEATSVKDAGGDLASGWYATTSNYNYAYFCNGSKGAWSNQVQHYKDDVWYVEAPAGNWNHVVLTRHSNASANWSSVITRTGNIWLYYFDHEDGDKIKMRQQNYIQNFYYDEKVGSGYKDGANWEYVAREPIGNPGTWVYEDEQICTDAAGTEYVLQAKNYDYENTYAHSWFKYESGVWTRLDQSEWYTVEDRLHIALPVTLGAAYSDVFYFLQCARPTMCRLIRVRPNQDCSKGACTITSFAAVASEANVTDKKTAINGVVAFDDKQGAGQLQIWCPGIDTVTIENADIQTPQTFTLHGFDASSAKNYTLHAKFLSGDGCEATYVVKVTPPTATPTAHTTTGTAEDLRLTRFTEEDVKLTPNTQTSTYFMWTNTANLDTVTTGERNHTFTAPTEEQTITYYFLATNDPEAPEGNLISNGDMEYNGKFSSSYTYWGIDIHEFPTYDDPTKPDTEKSGGYTLTKNSHDFYHSYNEVTPHKGTYFGLFDSKITDGKDQAAWIARSGSDNPKLKVHKGVSYLFSFWVANVNSYYQMDNGARLQFQISYNGGSTWHNLGGVIDLSNFKDNRWHGMSSLVTPTLSSTNVALRVINHNKSTVNLGNDFALDDIRFEAVTPNSSYIAGYESFPVTYLKCVINSATFEQQQPIGCGTAVADVDFKVNFTHPRGDLYIYEGTTLLAHIPHSEIGDETSFYTGVLKDQPLDNKDHVLTVYFDDGHVKTDAPTTYKYNAKNIPEISVASLTWGTVACDVPTVTLTAVINYTNQNGTLTANVDGKPANAVSYSVESDDTLQVTLVIPGIVADGLDGHLLNVNFSGSHGCAIVDHAIPEDAPYMPTVTVSAPEIQPYACGDPTYSVKVKAEFTNGQLHDIIFKDWQTGAEVHEATTTNDGTAEHTFTYAWDAAPTAHEYNVYFVGANTCDHKKSYTSPAEPKIDNVAYTFAPVTSCAATTYDLTVTFDYVNQDGTLSVDVDGTPASSITPAFVANSSDKQSATATFVGLPADGVARTITVKTTGGFHNCLATKALTGVPHLAAINSVSQAFTPAYSCGAAQYHVTLTVNYTNALGKDIKVKEGATVLKSIMANTGAGTFADDIQLDFAFDTNHALKVYFEDREECAEDVNVTSPVAPALSVTPSYIHSCDVATYSLRLDIAYTNQRGNNILANVDGGANVTKANAHISQMTEATDFIQIDGLVADGKTHQYNLRFDDAADCDSLNVNFPAPYEPLISATSATVQPYACGDPTYSVKVKAEFTNGQGHNLIFEDWNGDKKTVTTAAAETYKDCTFEYAWENPTTHSFKVYFEGAEDCKDNHVISFTSPFLPVIDKITVTGMPTSIACDAKDYTIGVNFTSLYTPIPAGKQIVITYDSLCNTKTTAPIDVTDFPYNLTLYNTATGTENTIYVAFADAPNCKKDYSYFPPARETCDCDTFTICEGDSKNWHGQDYTGPVGENKFVKGTDTLYLFVKEIPTITVGTIAMTCDDANVVRVPFSVVKGQPDSIGVAIGDSHLTATLDIVGTDTAFTFAPAAMKAGDYAAQVTVGTTGLSCTTEVDINFTIALSDYVYSKWTDVLFVSNKEGLFTAYQWFADGVAMTGETLQRLYDPNGLSGSSIVYHCRVTTTDGKTLYTCPQAFDDVTPSRTVDTTPANVKATTLYDSMGRVIKGTPHYGIYIVVEELENGEIRTRKITIHE